VRENPVKRTLAEGRIALGTMVFEFDTTGIARLAAAAGAEFVVFDQEHTGWSVERMRTLLGTARACDFVPIVRAPAAQYHLLARPLDVGAMGVMVPMVESAEQARLVVDAARYPPLGRRGVGIVYRDEWVDGDVAATMESANREVLVIAQIETASGIEQVDAIAAVEGIDVLWLGHFDLTASLGVPGQFESDAYHEAVGRLLAAAERRRKPVGIMSGTVEDGLAALERGFRCIAYSGDLWLYEQALRAGLAQLDAARNAR
jgi:2-dehydro-3-deoxyglucarate aldolase/4-hydroxy-2-oxoheptanedioate aldolase